MAHPLVSLLTVTNRDMQFLDFAVAQGRAQSYLEKGKVEHILVYNVRENDLEKQQVIDTLQYLDEQKAWGEQNNFIVKPLQIIKGKTHKADITLGECRNLGVAACQGEYVVVWDDDDLYHFRRIERQVEAAQEAGYAASTFDSLVVHETETRARLNDKERRSYLMHRRVEMVGGGKVPIGWEPTLCCKRTLMLEIDTGHGPGWPYKHLNTGEDTPCLRAIWKTRKIKVISHGVDDVKMYIYMRQGPPTANCDENEWYDLRQIKYDYNDVLNFALAMQPPQHAHQKVADPKSAAVKIPGLSEAILRPFLSWGSTRFPRPPPCGYLHVKDGNIVGELGQPAQLHGVSLFWSQWKPRYWKYDVIKWLKKDWRVNLIRAPVPVEKEEGFLDLEAVNTERIDTVVQACLALGVYVIVDWHSHNVFSEKDREASKAIKFFKSMAAKYGRFPHVIFETWNEPVGENYTWDQIKAYHEKVIKAIREEGASNLIVVSGPMYASITKDMLDRPVSTELGPVALSLHAYMQDKDTLAGKMRQATNALDKGQAVMVTEWGVGAPGSGDEKDYQEEVVWKEDEQSLTKNWVAFLKEMKLCHAVWSVSDKCELHAFLMPKAYVWTEAGIKALKETTAAPVAAVAGAPAIGDEVTTAVRKDLDKRNELQEWVDTRKINAKATPAELDGSEEKELWKDEKHLTEVGKYIRDVMRNREQAVVAGIVAKNGWIRRVGLPRDAAGKPMEGDDHLGISKAGIDTVEKMKEACESKSDCVGFAYRPAQSKRVNRPAQTRIWFPKKVGTFNPGTAHFAAHEKGENWEWWYRAATQAFKVTFEEGLPVTTTKERDSAVIRKIPKDEVVEVDLDEKEIVDRRVRAPVRPNGWITLWHEEAGTSYAVQVAPKKVGKVMNKTPDKFREVVLWSLTHVYVGIKMPNGDEVTIEEKKGDEYRVIWKGLEGWVKAHHIQELA